MKTLEFSDDDVIIINGVRVAGQLLREWTTPTPVAYWFRVIKRENGLMTIERRYDERLQ